MDFAPSDEQRAIADLSQQIFQDAIDDSYHPRFADSGREYDKTLWQTLASAGLLGTALPEQCGGSALGWLALSEVLQAQGKTLAPLPLWPALVCADALARWGDEALCERFLTPFIAGDQLLSVALEELVQDEFVGVSACRQGEQWQLSGAVSNVTACTDNTQILIPAQIDHNRILLCLLPREAVTEISANTLTNGELRYSLRLENCSAEAIAEVTQAECEHLLNTARTALAALTLGVVQEALQRTAAFTSERRQFGRPLAAFQAVSHRAADGYIDCEALRSCLWQAAWQLDSDRDAGMATQTAKWWACEAAHRIGHTAQHLHGGIGADLQYPIHRYYLWAVQLEFTLGGARRQLAASGRRLATDHTVGAAL